ncbi:hypothetical protein [Psychrosphaera haliotis]|uniref:Uncharacterized protein n=1 Tax=Psychrosphaera haliotis TaxID=555083 RepID=A0A6N8F617_9GAMM|nr:hypothetical protein [Psychrosphaera haliotis]MUH71995.1 hypothetical protein [Psychrosphaera haliotis]
MAISFSQMLDNLQKRLETEAIDEFKVHLESSLNKSERKLTEEYESISEEQFESPYDMESYKSMLEDQFYMQGEVRKLANELSISALYKQIELHTKRVTKRHLPSIPDSKFFNVGSLNNALPFNLSDIDQYDAFNELRLINNSIKHQGCVYKDLSNAFPNWKEGDEFKDLDIVYDRLYPKIKIYITALVSNLALHTE